MSTHKTDIMIQNEGSIVLFHLLTSEATEFVNENVSDESQYFGNALVVEPRYAQDLAQGMILAGLAVH